MTRTLRACLVAEGRGAHQGPEVDGSTTLRDVPEDTRVGDMIPALVVGSDGVDLEAVGATRGSAAAEVGR